MRKFKLFCFLSIAISLVLAKTYAFNYTITFTGSQASTSVTSVEVQNLTKGTTVIVPSGNTLSLYDVNTSVETVNAPSNGISIYPNPMQGKATLSFLAPQAGNTQINVFGVDGRNLVALSSNLEIGNNQFQLSLAPGAYILKVDGNGYTYAQRVISQSQSNDKPFLSFIGYQIPTNSQPQKSKGGAGVTSMIYSTGDQLLYKGISGNYATIVTDKPTESKTVDFYFVECKDADDNYYPVVIIGSQIWMAENLKTTSYRTGEGVSNVTNAASWSPAGFGAWCDYDNLEAIGTKYGHLYNWYAASDSRNVAPVGWHVPTDAEWSTLTTYLGGESVAGGKLKQTGIINWTTPNTGATNETGFFAFPGAYRSFNGIFFSQSNLGDWWTASEQNASNAWYRDMGFNTSNVGRSYYSKQFGFSIRCLSDIIIVIPPTLATTIAATGITGFTASSGGNVTLKGGAAVTARGICWSTTSGPTIALTTKTSDGTGTGAFTSAITGLTPNTTYYVRSYATNTGGTSYGTEVSFQTATTPSLTTTSASNVASTTATSGGNISSDGRATVTARGVCWSTSPSPTIYDNRTSNAAGTGIFTSALTVLFSSTTYYVRAYATNSVGTGYGNEQTLTTTMATDIDGNLYSSVKIGTQTWMGENLKTTKYRTGESISKPTTATNWKNATFGAWCDYNSDAANGIKYGHLYNFYAVADVRLIAPVGWHIPTIAEWETLSTYLGGESVSGGKLKEAGTSNWTTPNTLATNENNFTALPGGWRSSTGSYGGVGTSGLWWTSTEGSSGGALNRIMYYNYPKVDGAEGTKTDGISIRCVRDELPTLTTTAACAITAFTATSGGNITSDSSAAITARGVCWSTSPAPTINDNKTSDGTGTGKFISKLTELFGNTTYYTRAYATNAAGTSYGEEVSFSTLSLSGQISDIEGNVYNYITIGTQTWMVENLKTTKYKDGTTIPLITDANAWIALTSDGYCWYNNDAATNKSTYGALYNWYAVNSMKLAPEGWHVPTYAEWGTLQNYMRAILGETGSVAKALAGTTNWIIETNNGGPGDNVKINNSSGFTALPGGLRYDGGLFGVEGYWSYWWSSTEVSSTFGVDRGMTNYDNLTTISRPKSFGLSVRCIRDNIPTVSTTAASDITYTTAISGGSVSDDGGAAIIARGVCWSTTPNPTIADNKTSDGTGTGIFTSLLTGLSPSTKYYLKTYATKIAGTDYGEEVSFTTLDAPLGITDIDGNVYTEVVIGTQTWMVENLKTTKYNDGTAILSVTEENAWGALTSGAYCWFLNDGATFKSIYGALYNWYAVNTAKLAPVGWHVATDADWTTLERYVSANLGKSGSVAKALAATTSWESYTGTGTIGDDLTINNSSGFTALSGCCRFNSGAFSATGYIGGWWSSTESITDGTWGRNLTYGASVLGRGFGTKSYGFSVRCVKD